MAVTIATMAITIGISHPKCECKSRKPFSAARSTPLVTVITHTQTQPPLHTTSTTNSPYQYTVPELLGIDADDMTYRSDIPFEHLDFILVHGTLFPPSCQSYSRDGFDFSDSPRCLIAPFLCTLYFGRVAIFCRVRGWAVDCRFKIICTQSTKAFFVMFNALSEPCLEQPHGHACWRLVGDGELAAQQLQSDDDVTKTYSELGISAPKGISISPTLQRVIHLLAASPYYCSSSI